MGVRRAPPRTEGIHPRSAAWARAGLDPWIRESLRDHALAVRAARSAAGAISCASRLAAATWLAGGRWIFAGAGTSGRLAVQEAAECLPTFGLSRARVRGMIAGGNRALVRPVEGAEDDRRRGVTDLAHLRPGPWDLVVGVSASGKTPYVAGVLDRARRSGARTVLVTCGEGAGVPRADVRVAMDPGPEVVAGSTRLKAGTACKIALNHITTGAMLLAGRVREGRMTHLRTASAKLRERAVRIVADLGGVTASRARKMLDASNWDVALALRGVDRRG
ncbi:MAG: N-acetylmuramic acid 6-phosphate etherase [Planctomycetes bacterium]|nr:N-acetylmuramic acid 6-phosphate etherase [Planctomycetota bacterium]